MPGDGETHREGEVETHTYGGTNDKQTPQAQGPKGTWVQAKGRKVGANSRRKRRQTQACDAGRRDERQRLEGGGRGR